MFQPQYYLSNTVPKLSTVRTNALYLTLFNLIDARGIQCRYATYEHALAPQTTLGWVPILVSKLAPPEI